MSINYTCSGINAILLNVDDSGQFVEVAVTHNNSNHICHAIICMHTESSHYTTQVLGDLAVKYCGLTNDHDAGIS